MARRHGTLACYKHGCRRDECRDANREYDRRWRRLAAYGRPTTDKVDAEPVRQHVVHLQSAGMSLRQQSKLSGVPKASIQHLVYGVPSDGRPPVKKMNAENATRLLALRLTLDLLPAMASVDVAGTRRRALALATIGHTILWQSQKTDYSHANYWHQVMRESKVSAEMARRVRDLYNVCWDKPAPVTPYTRRARTWAQSQGGLSPLCWDDDLIDLSDADLAAELSRRAAAMDPAELHRCYRASREEGDRSPLIVAAAEEYLARRREQRAQARAA